MRSNNAENRNNAIKVTENCHQLVIITGDQHNRHYDTLLVYTSTLLIQTKRCLNDSEARP